MIGFTAPREAEIAHLKDERCDLWKEISASQQKCAMLIDERDALQARVDQLEGAWRAIGGDTIINQLDGGAMLLFPIHHQPSWFERFTEWWAR